MALRLGTNLYQDWANASTLLESGKEFDMEKTIFLTGFKIESEIVGYHFQIWKRCYPDVLDYAFITSCTPVQPRLTFNSEESKDAFLHWWDDLDRHFPEGFKKEMHIYPTLPHNKVVNGTIVPCMDKNKAWAWIVTKCKGFVWFIDNRLLFESDSDVVMYKMDFLQPED
jgi:hypothetical protein